MDYQRIYNQLIQRAKSENRKKLNQKNPDYVYYEAHHIIPRCMGGEGNADEYKTHPNIVLLTAREHFLAHWLLHRIYPDNSKLIFAWHRMSMSKHNGRNDVKISSRAYNELRTSHAKAVSKCHSGKLVTKETRDKIKKSQSNWNYKIKLSNSITNSRINNKNINVWNKGRKRHDITTCIFCGKIGIISNINRWHNKNCLKNPNLTKEEMFFRNKTRDVKKYKAILALDFDETIAKTSYPIIHGLNKNAKDVINKLYIDDYYIIINTCRTGKYLKQALDFLNKNGVKYHLANKNHKGLKKYFKHDCRKISFDLCVDDKNIGILYDNLVLGKELDWDDIYNKIIKITTDNNFKSILRLLDK